MKHVMVVLGTRPEAVKLAPVIRCLRRRSDARVTVCSTGQHREMLDETLRAFEIEPDIELNQMRPGQSAGDLLGRLIQALVAVFDERSPDVVVAQGDTTTVLAATLSGFLTRRQTAHVEAGLRTADRYSPFPEEMHRRVAGVVADLHFPPTDAAAAALRAEGVNPAQIFVTGNTGIDALLWMAGRVADRPLPRGVEGPPGGRKRLVLVTAHRRENFGEPLRAVCEAIRRLAGAHPDVAFVYPVHLNPNVRGPVHEVLGGVEGVHLLPPLSYPDLVALMLRSDFVLTDSGGLQEEAPSLGKPVLVLRENTERPEAVEAGVAKLVGTDPRTIVESATALLADERAYRAMARRVGVYGDGLAAERVTRALLEGTTAGVSPFRPGAALAPAGT